MITRILTALVGVVVFFTALALPIGVFPYIIFAVTFIMLSEMYSVLKCGKYVNITGYLASALAFMAMEKKGEVWTIFFASAILFYLIAVISEHGKINSKSILSHGFITVYISVFMSFVARVAVEFTAMSVMWIFIIAWICDSGAYFAGVFLGRHKLCPHISPKKTVEGAVGGVLATVIAGAVYYIIIIKFLRPALTFDITLLSAIALMCLVGSVLSQAGDFAASCIKRDSAVKDYGNVLPGHGGFMDRFDSVVFIAPFVYYALVLIHNFLM